jgi:hypothetical protein
MVVICGENNYKLDTRHVIDGVVVEVTREGEVYGSITNNRVAREKYRDLRLRRRRAGGMVLIQINFFTIFKICFMFPGNDLHWRFYYVDRQFKSIFTGGLQLPACKNDDFYWPLALAVTLNATKNRFTTASIDLLCTSDIA